MRTRYTRKLSFFIIWLLYMCSYWGYRKDAGLCEPLWSILLNCQLMMNREMMHILQAQVCGCTAFTYQGCHLNKRNRKLVIHQKVSDIKQVEINRRVMKFGRENQLNAHNYLSTLVIYPW